MHSEPINRSGNRKLLLNRRLSLLILVIGVVLMARQMYFDDEPGAIPLLLVIIGLVWYFITRSKLRSRRLRA